MIWPPCRTPRKRPFTSSATAPPASTASPRRSRWRATTPPRRRRGRASPATARSTPCSSAAPSRRPAATTELWITDISWREPETDAHLRDARRRGRAHLLDRSPPHGARAGAGGQGRRAVHRLGAERGLRGVAPHLRVPRATASAEERAARRASTRSRRWSPWPTTTTAGCTASRGRASWRGWCAPSGPTRTRTSSPSTTAVTYTPRMAAARDRVGAEIARSFAIAEREPRRASSPPACASSRRCATAIRARSPTPGARRRPNAVFALYDAKSLAVSLRRSPDCTGRPLARGRKPSAAAGMRRRRAARCPSCDARSPRSSPTRVARAAAVKPALTHVALGVARSRPHDRFYRKHARCTSCTTGTTSTPRVVWLSERAEEPDFVLVLFEVPARAAGGAIDAAAPRLRGRVARRGRRGRRGGTRATASCMIEPTYAGPIVGYFCIVQRPGRESGGVLARTADQSAPHRRRLNGDRAPCKGRGPLTRTAHGEADAGRGALRRTVGRARDLAALRRDRHRRARSRSATRSCRSRSPRTAAGSPGPDSLRLLDEAQRDAVGGRRARRRGDARRRTVAARAGAARRAAPPIAARRRLPRAARHVRRGRHHPGTARAGGHPVRRRRRARVGGRHGQGGDEGGLPRRRPAGLPLDRRATRPRDGRRRSAAASPRSSASRAS